MYFSLVIDLNEWTKHTDIKSRELKGENQLRSGFWRTQWIKDLWKHEKKEKNSFEPKMEKILAWKYSDKFWYFGHIFLLQY